MVDALLGVGDLMDALAHGAQAWLHSAWHIRVPPAWVQACVHWLLEESGQDVAVSTSTLHQQVLEQWLLTDLRDLSLPVLPAGLAQAHSAQVSGCFPLQVDSVLDVSQPAYAQLQRCRGTDDGNQDVSGGTYPSQRPWEARPTRMLVLQLTDGVQDLQGMEYQPVPTLSANVSPGCKLLLQGTVTCRLGVLLLQPDNVSVIGGEVERLLEPNCQERMLSRVLGLPHTQQNHPGDSAGDSGYVSRRTDMSTMESQSATPDAVTHFEDGDFDIPFDDLEDVLVTACATPSGTVTQSSSNSVSDNFIQEGCPVGCPAQTSVMTCVPMSCSPRTHTLSRPFTYLCVLKADVPPLHTVRVKAFIVTLLSSLRSQTGCWQVSVTISDGSDYLDVCLSHHVLLTLIGFSVPESKALRKLPEGGSLVQAGLERCQKQLVDMCCIMTLEYQASHWYVLTASEVTQEECVDLQKRVRERQEH